MAVISPTPFNGQEHPEAAIGLETSIDEQKEFTLKRKVRKDYILKV